MKIQHFFAYLMFIRNIHVIHEKAQHNFLKLAHGGIYCTSQGRSQLLVEVSEKSYNKVNFVNI